MDKIETRVLQSINIFPENRDFYEMMRNIILVPETSNMTIRCMCCAYWIRRFTRAQAHACSPALTAIMQPYACPRTHTQKYVMIIAFPRQQLFRERASLLSYTYNACVAEQLSPWTCDIPKDSKLTKLLKNFQKIFR